VLDDLLPLELSRTRKQFIAFGILCQCLLHRLSGALLSPYADKEAAPPCDSSGLAEHIVQFSMSALSSGPNR
jgi:hypothetical protein